MVDPPASAQTPAPAALAKASRTPPAGRTIGFHVVHRSTGKPLPSVGLTMDVGTTHTAYKLTDETGAVTFDYPLSSLERIRVSARKEGFMPMVVWIRKPDDEAEEFPLTFTLAMVPSIPIGGIVKDEEGRPIPGAKVLPFFVGSMGVPQSRAEIGMGEAAMTDARGHWTCPSIPSGYQDVQLVSIRVRHPDFQLTEIHREELEEAIGPKGTIVLLRGIARRGPRGRSRGTTDSRCTSRHRA